MKPSRCPNQNCESLRNPEGPSFEYKETKINPKIKDYFIQCKTCGTVIGAVDRLTHQSIMNKINSIPNGQSNLTMLQNSDNFDTIIKELYAQAEALKMIMKHLKIAF